MAFTKFIGDVGELKVATFMDIHDFELILVFQNASGNGLDILALKNYGVATGVELREILSIEVKTTTTFGSPSLSANQKKAFLNAGKILLEAGHLVGSRRFAGASPRMQRQARYILAALQSGVPLIPLAITVNIDKASAQHGFRIGSATAVKTKRVRIYHFETGPMPRKTKIYDSKLKAPRPKR